MKQADAAPALNALWTRLRAFQKFARFGAVGAVSTFVHGGVLAWLVESAGAHPTLANVAAFIAAFLTSYFGHYYVTFRSNRRHLESAPRYLAVALAGLTNNTAIFLLVVNALKIHYGFAFALAIVTTPLLVYALSQRFVYADETSAAPDPTVTAVKKSLLQLSPGIVFFLITTGYALTHYYRAPYADQWYQVMLYMKMDEGALTLADLFVLHGAHFHASAYVVLLFLAKLTGMNHFWEVAASLLISAAGFAGLLKILFRAARQYDYARSRIWIVGVAALFWWSLDQATNWIWGWQVAVSINTAGAVWCVYWLTAPDLNWRRLASAAAAAALALSAFATGAALLPVGLFVLLMQLFITDERNARSKTLGLLAGWLAVCTAFGGAFVYANYFSGDTYASETVSNPVNWRAIIGLLLYIQNFIANAVIHFSTEAASPVFALSLIVFGYVIWRNINQEPGVSGMAPFLALAAYGLGAAALTGLGRLGEFGAGQAFVSRYISFSNFYWIGLLCLLMLLYRRAPSTIRQQRAAVAFLIAMCVLKFGNVANVTTQLNDHVKKSRETAATIAETWPETDPALFYEFAAPHQKIDTKIAFIAEHELSLFRHRAR